MADFYNITGDVYKTIGVGDRLNYSFTNSSVPVTLGKGRYSLEVWGAKGGNASSDGGDGGYSVGTITLNTLTTLYVCCGAAGSLSAASGGSYNGGGQGFGEGLLGGAASGGGATHIALSQGELVNTPKENLLIVAGGGGGAEYGIFYQKRRGGSGGGRDGGRPNTDGGTAPYGGSQTSGGAGYDNGDTVAPSGSYGVGGGADKDSFAGGGGGLYGGGAGKIQLCGGAGGSGYIAASVTGATYLGEAVGNPDSTKNGYARIIYQGEINTFDIQFNGTTLLSVQSDLNNPSAVSYNGQTLFKLDYTAKRLLTKKLKCVHNIVVAGRNLLTAGKVPQSDIKIIPRNYYTLDNFSLGENGAVNAESGWCISPYYEVPAGCTRITIDAGSPSGNHNSLIEYDSNRGYLSYWGSSNNPRTFGFDYPAQIKYIRATFLMSALDNCYIKDETHGTYIFAGKNLLTE